MPTHLLLEGPDIESVLTRLREDHGPDAKIIQAELVRTGGFAGFFAKRRYEVTVEVDDNTPGEPGELGELGDRTELGDRGGLDDATEPSAGTVDARSAVRPVLSGIDALLDAAEGQDLTEVGGLSLPMSIPTIPAQGWHRPVSTEGEAFSDVLGALALDLADPAPVERPATFRSFGPPAIWAAAAATETADRTEDGSDRAETEPAETEPAETERAATERALTEPAMTDPLAVERTRGRLAALGMPERLLAAVVSAEPVLALRDITAALPTPRLPAWRPSATRGGALVVVVGTWELARSTVRGLVQELGADPSAVLAVATATGHDLTDAVCVRSHAAAVGLVQQARQTHDVSILVIDPGLTRHSAARAAETLLTLEPQSVLVAGDATTDLKVSLLALDALDQADVHVDALALVGVARALRPTAALEIPVPVSWVDGRFATTGGWLGLLVDAMEDRSSEGAKRGAHAKDDAC